MVFQLLMVLALTQVSLAKVSPNFNHCQDQFYNRIAPNGFANISGTMTSICQVYENDPLYASLYHEGNRTPLYSAYIVDIRPGDQPGSGLTFRLEPQLVNSSLPEKMMDQPATETAIRNLKLKGDPTALIKEKQAINSDYEGSGYDKGHLNPNAHHPDGPTQRATYTLTNVAPMNPTLNRGEWRTYEEHLRQMADNCITVYVVTGVVPGNTWIMEGGQRRVNIPSHIWSGYCCLDYSNKLISEGSLTPNHENAFEHMSIDNLQTELTRLLGTTITLFHNNCS